MQPRGMPEMADDRAEHSGPAPDAGRTRRAPPTIDLEAAEVPGTNESSGPEAEPKRFDSSIISAAIAALSGACAAALVVAALWFAGYLATGSNAPEDTRTNRARIDDLIERVGNLETTIRRPQPSAPDPVAKSRIDALDAALAALRREVGDLRAQMEKFAAAANEAKSTPSAPPPDLGAISERLTALENTTRSQVSEIAQDAVKAADDAPLRRLVAASLLDNSVRAGEPYPAVLAAAKSLAGNSEALKPLEGFASSGVPSAAALSRELLAQISRLSPPTQESSSSAGSIIDRLKAGAAKLVRIERADGGGNDRNGILGRVTAAALRNDYAEARRELKTLPAPDRASAQEWIDKTEARDAALAASRQFATEAMGALGKSRQ
jgi:hypothetical protein